MKSRIARLVFSAMFYALCAMPVAAQFYSDVTFVGSVHTGSYHAVSGISAVTTNGGYYTNAIGTTNCYRLSGTNLSGRIPLSTNVVVVWTPGVGTNAVRLSWTRAPGVLRHVIEKSYDGGSTWTNWLSLPPSTASWTDTGANVWTSSVFTNLCPAIPAGSYPWATPSDVPALDVDTLDTVASRGNSTTNDITIGAPSAEMVTNGACASTNGWHSSTGSGSPWTLNTSSTNYYLYTQAGGWNILTQTVPLPVISNHLYRVSFRYTGGPIQTRLGGQTTDWPGVGDWTNVTATYLASSTNSIEVCDNTSFMEGSSSVDDVSVKELRGDLTVVRNIAFGGTATGDGSGLYNLVNAASPAQGVKADTALQVESDTLATVCSRGNRITNSVVLAVYGTELTTNGTFTGNTYGWNIETFILGSEEMGYSLLAYSSDPTATASPSNVLPVVVGRVYRISFSAWGATPGGSIDMIATVGGFSNVWHQAEGGPSECTAIFQASDTNNLVITSPYTGTYARYLDNVSVVELSTGVDAMCLTGSLIFGTNAQFFGLATNSWSTNSTFLRSADGLHLYWGGSP